MTTGTATAVRKREEAAARRSRLRRIGPHYRSAAGRPPRVAYDRIAECFIEAVELELPPVSATAVAVQVDKLWLERRLWEVRRVGWLPKGPSPRPGEDRVDWLAGARALLAHRRAERAALLAQGHQRRELAVVRRRARQAEKRSYERALRPPKLVLDRFALF